MRNDDYEAVEALERALRSAEREIAELEREAKAREATLAKVLHEFQELQCPTHMGEPVINTVRDDARRYRWLRHNFTRLIVCTDPDYWRPTQTVTDVLLNENFFRVCDGESVDKAIDAAIQRYESSQSA
jgi:hypothetical protein